MADEKAVVEIGGRELAISNLKRVFYPQTGFTKGNVLDYSVGVSPELLPCLKDRPLTLKRYPEGVEADFFYQRVPRALAQVARDDGPA